MRNTEGPKEIVIPEQKFLSCQMCKHYSHQMVKSGNHPIYASNCNHPEIPNFHLFSMEGNLRENFSHIIEMV